MLIVIGTMCSIKVPAFREIKQSYKNYNLPSAFHTKETGSIPFTFSKQKRGLGEDLGSWAIPTSAINSGKYKSPSVRFAEVHAPSGGYRFSFNYSQGTERMSSQGLFFYNFPNNESSNCFCWNPWPPVFSFSFLSIPPTHRNSPPPFFWSEFDEVWFLPLRSLSGWIKSQLALVNHPGSALGIGETFYFRLNHPPVLTWPAIYSYTESIITGTSKIQRSPELHYYETFVEQPMVSAPNWFILASVEQGGRGEGSQGPSLTVFT